MRVVIFETEPWEEQRFRDTCEGHEITYVPDALTHENVADCSDAEIVSTFIYSDMGREILAEFGDLKLIATRSTGYDHIDTEYCEQNGILVSNVPT